MAQVVRGGAAAIARLLQTMPTRLIAAVTNAERENLDDAASELITASRGAITTAQLIAMGRPFARRAPQSDVDPSIINDQGGPFSRDWLKEGPNISGDPASAVVVAGQVENTDSVAKYMLGTLKMIARPIIDRVRNIIRKRRNARIRRALQSVLRGVTH